MNAIIDQQTANAIGKLDTLPRQTANPAEIARNFPLRIASIIVPLDDNDGQTMTGIHDYVQTVLLNTYGGFTAYAASGGWRDPLTGKVYHDASVRYDVAMEDHGLHYIWLEDFAREIGALTHQEAIAITYPNGAFRVVPTCDE